jgi:tRNA (guanine10-N2)-dimethyltransferase
MTDRGRRTGVYVLEFAGQDDRFALEEATSAASDVTLVAAGLATARGVTDRMARLAFTRRASALLGTTDPAVESAEALLGAAALDRSGSVAVRAVDVRSTTGIDTQRVERALGTVLVERGFTVDLEDPDHELRALFAGPAQTDGGKTGWARDAAPHDDEEAGVCALGWLAVEADREFARRRPTDRPFFQPGSMDPTLARALVNVAGARQRRTVLDPMCGTGGLVAEAGAVGARVVGADVQPEMVQGARENLAAELQTDYDVLQADARRLPLSDGAVDAAVVDVPYGRQSRIAGDSLAQLVGESLAELARVAARAVVVADQWWLEGAQDAGWTVDTTFERRVHRSLVRHVHVLE